MDQTPPKKAPRTTRNLILRGGSALAALGLIYYSLRYDAVNESGWAWAILLAAASTLGLREFYRFCRGSGASPFGLVGYVLGPLLVLALEWDLSGSARTIIGHNAAPLVFLAACVCAMALQLTVKTNDAALTNVSLTMYGIVYCCLLPGVTLFLRHLRLGKYGWPLDGVEFVIVCIFIAKVSDVGALLTGSRWGKHKLIPRLSPGKTWEGAIGGLLFSVLLLQFMVWTNPSMALARLGRPMLVILSIILTLGGLAGDLIESAFKRNSRLKDAGTGVPGFGGILDLTDSMMIATPLMYFFLVLCGAEYVQS